MRVDGISVSFIDIPHDQGVGFNQWYDLDHLPMHISKPDVLGARRYVATAAARNARGVGAGELTSGHAPYATVYLYGGPLPFMTDEAMQGWLTMDRAIVKDGRYWHGGGMRHSSYWNTGTMARSSSILVSDDAVPYLAHRSVIFAYGRAPDRDEAIAWWEATQRDQLLDVPGVVAIAQYDPAGATEPDLLLHLLMCSEPAAEIIERVDDVRRYQRMTGRFPAYGGVYEQESFLPYDLIVPYRYDFIDAMDG
jgi:hypothetical protein